MTKFFVTTVHNFNTWHSRCVGYYDTLEEADRCVRENYGDIWEYSYDYAVIEEFDAGIYPRAKSEHWYKWEGDESGGYVPVPAPDEVTTPFRTCNFGIG